MNKGYYVINISGVMLPVEIREKNKAPKCFTLAARGDGASKRLSEEEYNSKSIQALIKKKKLRGRITENNLKIS